MDRASSWTRLWIWPIIVAACMLVGAATALAGESRSKAHGNPAAAPGHGPGGSKAQGARGGKRGSSRGESARSRSRGASSRSRGHSRGHSHRGRSRGTPAHPGSHSGGSKSGGSAGATKPGSSRRGAARDDSSRSPGGPDGKVTICHATGSETNPFVRITVSVNALPAHTRHQHGEDVVNPTGPCGAAVAAKAVAAGATPPSSPAVGDRTGVSPGTVQPPAEAASPPEGRGVRGVTADAEDPAPAGTTASRDRATASSGASGSLPFTGFAVLFLALIGTGAALAGTKLRGSTARGR